MMGLDDERPATHSHDAAAFSENDFHEGRFLVQLARQLHRAWGRLNVVKVNDLPLGLGDDFLGDDHNVIVFKMSFLPGASVANQAAD